MLSGKCDRFISNYKVELLLRLLTGTLTCTDALHPTSVLRTWTHRKIEPIVMHTSAMPTLETDRRVRSLRLVLATENCLRERKKNRKTWPSSSVQSCSLPFDSGGRDSNIQNY